MKLRIKPFISFVICALAVIITASIQTTNAQGEDKQEKNRSKEVQQYLYPLLHNPLFVGLDWSQPFSWQEDRYSSIRLPRENAEHPEGVFWTHNMHATIWSKTPIDVSVDGKPDIRVIIPLRVLASGESCTNNALALLKNVYPWFFQKVPLPTPIIQGPDRKGIWYLEWQRYSRDELPDTRIRAGVRSIDGKVVSFGSSKLVGSWEHKITPTQAKQKAVQLASKDQALAGVEVAGWSINGSGGTRFYDIQLKARDRKSGQVLYLDTNINAMTGEVGTGSEGWQPAEEDRPARFLVNDSLPVWTKHGLAFVSDRKLAGMPKWAVVPFQLFLQNQEGNLLYLTSDLGELPSFSSVSCLSNSSWLGIEWHGWTYALNLQDGDYRVLGHPERRGTLPSINSDGSWAVVMGTGHSGSTDFDLMPDKLKRNSPLSLRGRLVMPNADEHHPLFSPDGQWVYFIDSRKEKGQWLHKLQRMHAAAALVSELKRVEQDQVQTIAALSEDVERLSIFSDGAQVLLQNRKGMFIVSVPEGKIMPVILKDLRDAELGVIVEDITNGWAGPSDDRVTFSGKTTDKDGKVRRRIYSCRFDGSDLKAHTPKDNEPVPMYKFPGSDKTAYDLAKEWALNEIKWDDEHRSSR
jgi:hypothetical protein